MPHGATDFSNRYEEDIAAAAGMGCQLFRFSTAWARVEISEGVFDEAALAHNTLLLSGILNTASSFGR